MPQHHISAKDSSGYIFRRSGARNIEVATIDADLLYLPGGDIEGWLEFISSVRVIIMYDGHLKLHQFMYHFIVKTRKHSSRMCTNRAVTRPSSEQVVI